MFRFAVPTILIGTSIAGFFFVVKPTLSEITAQKEQIASYNEALNNSKSLESVRDELTKQYDEISKDDLAKLHKLLPDNVDNVRLIIEIGEVAKPYGMVLKNVSYDASNKAAPADPNAAKKDEPVSNSSYGVWNLGFTTQGSYADFLSFLKDLESNLRIVDISSISFSPSTEKPTANNASSATGVGINPNKVNDSYSYSFKIKTYWLKN